MHTPPLAGSIKVNRVWPFRIRRETNGTRGVRIPPHAYVCVPRNTLLDTLRES